MSTSLYDQLANVQVKDATAAQLNSGGGATFIESNQSRYWGSLRSIAQAILDSRTYGYGLPVPEQSATSANAITSAGDTSVKPPATEEWMVEAIAVTVPGCG